MSDPEFISLTAFGERILVSPGDDQVRGWLLTNFGALVSDQASGSDAALTLLVQRKDSSFEISRAGGAAISARNPADLIYRLEKIITIELQKRRSDLLFVHAAAVEWNGRAILLAGDTGAGKSTTTWALLNHGFGYLSDELGAVSPDTLDVLPYPHAICLKKRPPAPYALPASTMDLGRTMHVPASALEAAVIDQPLPLCAVFLLRHDATLRRPRLRSIGPAEAGARLYVSGLNALAHADAGLAAVLSITGQVPSYSVTTAGLLESCKLIRSTVEQLAPCSSSRS